jgi:ABC-type nitrate/sulfonate/bicarbonate transport system substrate-binding protein
VLNELKRKTPALASMQIIQGAMGTQLALLESGKTDIAADLEPAVAQAESRGYRVVLNLNKFTQPQAVTGLTVRQDTIVQHPDQVQRMVNALQQAITAIYRDHAIAYYTAQKLFPNLGDAVIKRAVDHMLHDAMYPSSVVVSDDYWQRSLRTRLASGEMKHPQATEIAVDNRFAANAVAKYGK